MSAVALPSSSLTIRRALHDGAGYEVAAPAPGLVTLLAIDADGDTAPITVDRAGARQLIEDITLAAGLAPTAPQLGAGQALRGSARILFERLRELKRTDPAEADVVVATIVMDLRSWDPISLLIAQVAQ
jgi:hypothetical protein